MTSNIKGGKLYEQANKNKNIIAGIFIFFFFFISYFSFSLILSKTQAFAAPGLLFETDTLRVINDTTSLAANHYRTKVHPLYVLLVNPLGMFLSGIFKSQLIASLLINSFFGAVGTLLAYVYFHLLTKNLVESCLLAGLFGVTASQFFLSVIPETSALAICSLLLTYILFVAAIKHGRSSTPAWIAAGIFALAITTTNFVQTCICFLITTVYLSPKKNRFLHISARMVLFSASVIILAMMLSLLQKDIYPSSRLFYTLEFYEEETLYTSFVVLEYPLTVLSQLARHFFLVNIIAPYPVAFLLNENTIAVTFSRVINYSVIGWAAVALWILLFTANFSQALKDKQNSSTTVSFALILCLIFNLSLHSIYGIGSKGDFEYFLYTGNFTFLSLHFMSILPYSSKAALRYFLALLILLIGINNMLMLTEIINIYK